MHRTASEGRQNISRAARGDVSRFLRSGPQFLPSVKWGGRPAGCRRGPSPVDTSATPQCRVCRASPARPVDQDQDQDQDQDHGRGKPLSAGTLEA